MFQVQPKAAYDGDPQAVIAADDPGLAVVGVKAASAASIAIRAASSPPAK